MGDRSTFPRGAEGTHRSITISDIREAGTLVSMDWRRSCNWKVHRMNVSLTPELETEVLAGYGDLVRVLQG